ncbi:hypothetical protein Geoth_1977 [Parageobacillus thermoglucosidasius C56-YS93]|uniref:Uncharacterized protein n=1 Tax=Geobacillus sp. (strain Y4.1MC1) TaxID=581103 RepID=A0A7U3YFI4_GEOS0|nr:hypothetical protein Geoth_1977 [Parageobacillus thermoglucosidasius C56-YS93]
MMIKNEKDIIQLIKEDEWMMNIYQKNYGVMSRKWTR